MATLSQAKSRRLYSWWWDSHISPKNSKWLQENLTDMDTKLKAMIKLIEEDADSFARRAEMYYKKRPELMKLLEEFYRAYRALAERYDHATVVIRQTKITMDETYPNQDPSGLSDDSPVNFEDPRMISNSNLYDTNKVRKGLNFDEVQESEEIIMLKKALEELEAEKEDWSIQYQLYLGNISKLESEISLVEDESREFDERAKKAESEVEKLKEELSKLEAEKEANLREYLEKISNLEEIISESETRVDFLTSEKDTALNQYVLSLEKISNLENKLEYSEEDAKNSRERVEEAENLIETLKQKISELLTEKEAVNLEYKMCLETISTLENKLSSALMEVQQLKDEVNNGVSKCLLLETVNKTLNSELESVMLKIGVKDEELTDQRNTLQQEINSLNEELTVVNKKHLVISEKLEELKDENSSLKEVFEKETYEKEALVRKLEIMGQLFEKNENSVMDLSVELEGAGGKIKALEKSCQSFLQEKLNLLDEKSDFESQLHNMNDNLEKLEENNTVLKSSLSDELQTLKIKLRSLEDEKISLVREYDIELDKALHSDIENFILRKYVQDLKDTNLSQVKIHELIQECNRLRDENTVKDIENEGLKARLDSYGTDISSLRECISSLENKTMKPKNQEFEGGEMIDSSLDLQDLAKRVRDIEKRVVETEKLVLEENLNVNSQLNAGLIEIEELKSQNSIQRRNLKAKSEISEADNDSLMTKDIMLDHVSESSAYVNSLREKVEADNQICELWETADKDDSIDLTMGKMVNYSSEKSSELRRIKSVRRKRRDFPSSEALMIKDLSVDKVEISKDSFNSVQEANNRKVLLRLDSDLQKLMNLHITVQDMKWKLEIINSGKKGKDIEESDSLKGQLQEAEATIMKLMDLNGKLMKSVEENLYSSEFKSAMEYEDSECIRRRRISEQARRISEKIGRVQLEVQKIQFVLLKADDAKESKGKTRETKRRVLLKDYLYGGMRGVKQSKRKKVTFCACVQPPTQGD